MAFTTPHSFVANNAKTKKRKEGKPWLLRFFDQIRFYEVSADELLQMREDFVHGRFKVKVEEDTFDLKQFNQYLKANQKEINTFKTHQQRSFEEERERWIANGQATFEAEPTFETGLGEEDAIPDGCHAVATHVSGNVWKIQVEEGQVIQKGDTLVIVESMKMEINILASQEGTIEKILCAEGSPINAGQNLCIIR